MISKFIKKLIFFLSIFSLLSIVLSMAFIETEKIRKRKNFNAFKRRRWNDFHSLDSNSQDMIFVGTSHVIRGINPKIIEEMLKIKTFNIACDSHPIFGSYYVIKEILDTQKPDYLLLDLYWECFNDFIPLSNIDSDIEYMSSHIKEEYIDDNYTLKEKIEYFVPFLKYRKNIVYITKSIFGIGLTNSLSYNNDKYLGKGFIGRDEESSYDDIENMPKISLKNYKLGTKNLNSLNKIIKMCSENNIELIFTVIPSMPSYMRNKISDYKVVSSFLENLSEKNNLKFYDFDLEENLKYFDDSDFLDYHHLNNKGAEKFSNILAEKLKNDSHFNF